MSAPRTLLWAFSTFALGGPQRRFLSLCAALGSGYRHRVFAMDGDHAAAALFPAGVDCDIVERPIEKGAFLSRRNISTMRDLLGEMRPDVLLTCNWGCIEWFIANRGRRAVPHLHFEDGFGPDERPDAQNAKRVWARRLLFRKPRTWFIAPSEVLADVYRRVWRVPAARLHTIPNGVDLGRFGFIDRAGSAPPVVVTVAALRAEKRLDRLIEAVAGLPAGAASLHIVGDGPERATLEAAARDHALRVVFCGAQADVVPFLAQADIFAMSSDTEQMPIGLVEAMATGLPVVATDVGDTRRMVSAPNRRLVVGPDATELCRAIEGLISDPELRRTLGRANAEKARAEYGLGAMAARYVAVLEEAISTG